MSGLRAKWREELLDLQSMIEPAKNEEIARRAIHIAWACLEKAENQAIMLQIYQDKMKETPLGIVICEQCKHYMKGIDQDDICRFRSMQVVADDYCSYGEQMEEEE